MPTLDRYQETACLETAGMVRGRNESTRGMILGRLRRLTAQAEALKEIQRGDTYVVRF